MRCVTVAPIGHWYSWTSNVSSDEADKHLDPVIMFRFLLCDIYAPENFMLKPHNFGSIGIIVSSNG
jgi:hypothetical protein